MANDAAATSGTVRVVLTGPDGEVKHDVTQPNLITQVGNQVYAERGGGTSTPPAAPTGMALGTNSATAPATTGAGAALVAGITGSAAALTSATAGAGTGTARRITYVQTWAAGTPTGTNAINEVVLQNGTATTVPTNAATANIIARSVLASTVNKTSADSLTITWTHDIGS